LKGDSGPDYAYLLALVQSTPSARGAVGHAKIIRERSAQRSLIALGQHVQDAVLNIGVGNVDEILDDIERRLLRMREKRVSGPVDFTALLSHVLQSADQKYHADTQRLAGLSTGFVDLDRMTDGLEAADLVIIAGRPSMGKTAIAMNVAEHVALEEKQPVLVFSLEMSDKSLVRRMLGSCSRVDQHKLKNGRLTDDDWGRLTAGVSRLSGAPIVIEETTGLSIGELRARARRTFRRHGKLGLIIVDYLQLMAAQGETRNLALTEVSQGLKALAKEPDTPVCALSQLNRGLDARANKRPVMSDLRDSGAIEQDADKILFIYRDEEYNPDSIYKGMAEVIVGKNRNGPTGTVNLTWLRELTRFENFAGEVPRSAPRKKERGFQSKPSQAALYAD
jgi:replicative DNA helicase